MKQNLKTFVLKQKIDIEQFAYSVLKDTDVRLILDAPDQDINGSITCYPITYKEENYTLVDIVFYGEDVEMVEDEKINQSSHILKKNTKTNINKVSKFINSNFEVAPIDISTEIVKILSG